MTDRFVRPGESSDLKPGETIYTDIRVPSGAASLSIKVDGECDCGGKLIPHPRKPLVWICEHSRWWNRMKHAYLIGEKQGRGWQ
jgi:hypothetical protein